jgi:hypothetical protein
MSTRQKTKNRANVYNDPPGYYDMNSYNPRSRVTMSQGHYNAPHDARVIADKVKKIPINIEEILRSEALNDADPVRYWKTLNSFRPFSVYLDFSHCNSYETAEDDVYIYDFTRSTVRSNNSDKAVVTSGIIRLTSGSIKMPLYLQNQGLYYDLSEVYVYFRNLPMAYNNGIFPYHFKYYPTQQLQVTDTSKLLMLPEQPKFAMTTPHQMDTYEMVIRDKAGNIMVPYPTKRGVIVTGNPTVITSVAHGLQTGYFVTRITLTNRSTPAAIQRYYPIIVIDADNFSIPVDTTSPELSSMNGSSVSYLVDNYNFELDMVAININWDEEQTFPGTK